MNKWLVQFRYKNVRYSINVFMLESVVALSELHDKIVKFLVDERGLSGPDVVIISVVEVEHQKTNNLLFEKDRRDADSKRNT